MRILPFAFWRVVTSGGGAPTVVSADQADPLGGDVSIVTVDSTSGVTDADIDGASVPFFVIDGTHLAIVTSAQTAGSHTVGVTNGTGRGTGTIVYWTNNDASTTLRLERGQYVGDTWTDQSAGGNNFSDATYFPPETNKEPQFYIDGAVGRLGGPAWSALIDASNYSLSFMLRARSLVAPPGTAINSPCVIADSGGYAALAITDSWIKWLHHDGAYEETTIATPMSLLDDHVIDIVCNAGSIKMRIDGGSWTAPTSVGPLGSLASLTMLGDNFVSAGADIDLRGAIISNVARSDAWFDENLTWWEVRHGFKSTAGEPEIDAADSDVFDPAGGDRLFLKGRNLAGMSGRVGTTSLTNVKVFGDMPDCAGTGALTTSLALSNFVGATPTAYSFAVLVYVHDLSTYLGASADAAILSDAGAVSRLHVSTNGVRWSVIASGPTDNETPWVPLPTKQWVAIRGKWDGTNIYLALNNAPFGVGVAGGSFTNVSGALQLGCNYDASAIFNGLIAEALITDTELSDADFTNIVAGWNYDYGLNLSGVPASSFDRATLSLTGLWQAGNYVSGTFAATASAGSSGGRDATTTAAAPRVSSGEYAVATVPAKSAGTYPLYVVNGSGSIALTDAIEYFDIAAEAGLYHRLRADLGATTTAGGTELAALADQSGTGDANKDIAVHSSGTNPSYLANDPAFGGRASWGTSYTADEADKLMISGTFASSLATPYTAYQVDYLPSTSAGANRYPRGRADGFVNGPGLYGANGGSSTMVATNNAGTVTYAAVIDGASISCVVYDNSGAVFRDAFTNAEGTGDLDEGVGYISLETGSYLAQPQRIRTGEILIFSGAHDVAKRRKVTKTLGAYYGIKVAA